MPGLWSRVDTTAETQSHVPWFQPGLDLGAQVGISRAGT